jgi:hypothetical protein
MQYIKDIYVELHCNRWKREERTRQFSRGEERSQSGFRASCLPIKI